MITRRDIFDTGESENSQLWRIIKRPPAIVFDDNSLREAADHMIAEGVGRLPVVARGDTHKVIGWLTRSDLLSAHRQRLEDASQINREIKIRTVRLNGRSSRVK